MPKLPFVKKETQAILPTEFGKFQILVFRSNHTHTDRHEQIVLQKGDLKNGPVLVRIHSSCLTGDILHSLKCDCGKQLSLSLKKITRQGGLLIYLNQEGRGIGILNKIRAYHLQDKKLDTVEANIALGLPIDARDYSLAAAILKKMRIKKIKLLTNNPQKIDQLQDAGVKVLKRIPLEVLPNKFNKFYLETKKKKMGHKLKKV